MIRPRALALAVLLIVYCLIAVPAPSRAASTSAEAKKIAHLLDGTGLAYAARKANVWTVEFAGKKLGRSTVIVTYDKNLLVMFAVVARGATLQKSPPLLLALLRANHSFDYAKIGFDDDGDLFVRIDAPLRLADARQLRDDIKQVISVSDELFGRIAPFVKR